MVNDLVRYLTREVVGGDGDRFSRCAISGTLFTDGFDVVRDFGEALGLCATLT